MKELLRKHGQTIINVFLVVCLGHYALREGGVALREAWFDQRFDFVELGFFVQNTVMVTFILIRRQHRAIDRNVLHQAVALVAFFSGITFVKTAEPAAGLVLTAQVITAATILLGTFGLVNLGRSFGILVAVRTVKTGGLYAAVRHPLYATTMLGRVGFILQNPCALNFVIFVFSSGCYVYRAILEEKYLSRWPEYREYMQKVGYRFVPGIF